MDWTGNERTPWWKNEWRTFSSSNSSVQHGSARWSSVKLQCRHWRNWTRRWEILKTKHWHNVIRVFGIKGLQFASEKETADIENIIPPTWLKMSLRQQGINNFRAKQVLSLCGTLPTQVYFRACLRSREWSPPKVSEMRRAFNWEIHLGVWSCQLSLTKVNECRHKTLIRDI